MIHNDLVVSASDADVLARLVGEVQTRVHFDAHAAGMLADVLAEAQSVPHELLPADRVAMNSLVTYCAEETGEAKTVKLVHPVEADPQEGRLSVLSPLGSALLGRGTGARVLVGMPDGRESVVRIMAVERRGREAPAANPCL